MFTYLFPNPLRKHWHIIDPFLTLPLKLESECREFPTCESW
jgi:hypothetical protein